MRSDRTWIVVAAAELLRDVVRESFAQRIVMLPDEWADAHHVITRGVSAESGRWQTSRTPYLRRILRMFAHSRVRHLTFMSGSQLGKTSLIDILKQWVVDQDPGPTLVMYGNVDEARNYNQDRFIPSLEAAPRVRRHLMPSPQDTKNLKIKFDHMTMWFVGSNARSGRRGKPIRYLFLDEIGTYDEPRQGPSGRGKSDVRRMDPGWVEVYERVKGSFGGRHKIVDTSTPDDEGRGIHGLYQGGTREAYHVPCPHCGEFQTLSWKGLRWEGGSKATKEQAKATAHYVCRGCKGRIEEFQKGWMLARGVWVPEGATAAECAGHQDEPDATGRGRAVEHLSWGSLGSLYSPFPGATWGDVAEKFAANRFQMTPDFVTGWLGEAWKPTGDTAEVEDLKRLAGGYSLGQCPEGVLALVLSADVQKDRIYTILRGYGEYGRESWLVDRRVLPRAEGDNCEALVAFARVLARDGVPRLGSGGKRQKCRVALVDSGHFTDEVYHAVRAMTGSGLKARAVKGYASSIGVPWRVTLLDKMADGKTPIPGGAGGVELLSVNTDVWKSALLARMKGRPDASELEEDGGADQAVDAQTGEVRPAVRVGWWLPQDVPPDYLEQVTSETRGEVHGPRGLSYEWMLRPGRQDNHDFDAEVYNLAGADSFQIRTYGKKPGAPSAPPAPRPERGTGWMDDFKEL